jgi:hypothetical protein
MRRSHAAYRARPCESWKDSAGPPTWPACTTASVSSTSRGGALSRVLRSYRKALTFLSRTDEYEEICTTAVNIAYVYIFSGGWRMAVEYLDQALRMMGRIGLVDLRYHPAHYIWALLGIASVRDGKLSRAMEMVERIRGALRQGARREAGILLVLPSGDGARL